MSNGQTYLEWVNRGDPPMLLHLTTVVNEVLNLLYDAGEVNRRTIDDYSVNEVMDRIKGFLQRHQVYLKFPMRDAIRAALVEEFGEKSCH